MKSVFLTLTLAASAILSAEPAKPAPASQPATSTAKVVDLRVESQTNPTAVNTPLPRFSWRIETEQRGWLQTTYHVLAASTSKLLDKNNGDLWDSGETPASFGHFISFPKTPLQSGQVVHWKVRAKGRTGSFTKWSQPAVFTVQLTGPDPFPAPLFLPTTPRISAFECSNPNLTRIYELAASRLHEVTNLGEIGLSLRAASYHQPLGPRTRNWLHGLNASLNEANLYPVSLPSDGTFGSFQSDTGIWGEHAYWWASGDQSALTRNWSTMQAYLQARRQIDPDCTGLPFGSLKGIIPAKDPAPPELYHAISRALNQRLMLEMARVASKNPYDAQMMTQATAALQSQFQESHILENGSLAYDSIPAHVLALRSGLLTTEEQKEVLCAKLEKLLKSAPEEAPFRTCSLVAANLLPVLTWSNRHDYAIELSAKENPESLSPTALASISEWLMSMVVGIGANRAGFQDLRIEPYIPSRESLEFAKAHLDLPQGRVMVNWLHNSDSLTIDVSIPPNSNAMIRLPLVNGQTILEGEVALEGSKDVFAIKKEAHTITFRVLSGNYRFTIK